MNKKRVSKKIVKKGASFKTSPLWLKIAAGGLGVATLTFAGLFTWKAIANHSAKHDTDICTVKWVDEDGSLMSQETYKKGELPTYKGEYHDKAGIFKNDGEEYMHFQEGWEEELSPVTQDTTFHAVYSDRLLVTTMKAEFTQEDIDNFGGELPIGFIFRGDPNHVDWDDGESGEADKYSSYHLYKTPGTHTIKIYGNVKDIYTQVNGIDPPSFTAGDDFITSASYGCSIEHDYSSSMFFTWDSRMSSITFSSRVLELDYSFSYYYTVSPELEVKFDKNPRCRYIIKLLGDSDNPANFKNFTVPNTIVGINEDAFSGDESLEKVAFEPNSRCEYIGDSAFRDCSSLKEFDVSENLKEIRSSAFNGCSSLEKITLHKSINHIGTYAFAYCTKLESLIFEKNDNEVYFGEAAFLNDASLSNLVLPAKISTSTPLSYRIFQDAQLGKVVIPDGTTYLADYLFNRATFTDSVAFPNSLEEIGESAFEEATMPEEIDLSNTHVSVINDNAFSAASELKTVKLPSSIKALGERSFYGVESLETVTFSEGTELTTLGEGAFSNCASLKNINLPKTITELGDASFSGCKSLESFNFKEYTKIDTIPLDCFNSCSSLTSIEIGENIFAISGSAFNNCGLTSVKIPKSVKVIGMEAFTENDNLTTVDLTEFTEPSSDKIPTINMESFPTSTGVQFIVKNEEMKAFFESAPMWSDYTFVVQ